MVSLGRYVRNKSANQFTGDLLRDLDVAVRRYAEHNGGQLPPVTPLIPEGGPVPDELTLHHTARRNNEEFVRALKVYIVPARPGEKANTSDNGKSPPATAQPSSLAQRATSASCRSVFTMR